jgi:hypothetical protein
MTGPPGDGPGLGETVGDPPHRRKEAVDAPGSDLVFALRTDDTAPVVIPELRASAISGTQGHEFLRFPPGPWVPGLARSLPRTPIRGARPA